jgi:hypothetical protein
MPNVKLVLCQDSAFDNFANLALQLEREGIAVEFIWPWHEGPLNDRKEPHNWSKGPPESREKENVRNLGS